MNRSIITMLDGTLEGRYAQGTREPGGVSGLPLVVCLHGGCCTWNYFDVEGASLVERATRRGFDVLCLNRPGHGASDHLASGPRLLMRNADILTNAISEAADKLGRADVVLIGNSIGGAIAICMAAAHPLWLRGVAVASVGIRPHTTLPHVVNRLRPVLRTLKVPSFAQKRLFFGPKGSYDPQVAERSMRLKAPALLDELHEIVFWWPKNNAAIASKVRVPVDAALGEWDALWNSSSVYTDDFGRLFTVSPSATSKRVDGAGHCVDLHYAGAELHEHQLYFACQCMRD